jgi:pyruvate/2-oxoglutarate dehydrogenase complex dihydrolipoamide acyltransferase (E2) component
MATDVIMPQMGESIAEGTIVKWLKKVGEKVTRDEPLFEISTDKVDAEIPSPGAGVLTEIKVKEGETVPVNSVVAVIGGSASAPAPGPSEMPQAAAGQPETVGSSSLQAGDQRHGREEQDRGETHGITADRGCPRTRARDSSTCRYWRSGSHRSTNGHVRTRSWSSNLPGRNRRFPSGISRRGSSPRAESR